VDQPEVIVKPFPLSKFRLPLVAVEIAGGTDLIDFLDQVRSLAEVRNAKTLVKKTAWQSSIRGSRNQIPVN
jgi:hypothetical protein